jgi:hypothetical protein
MVVSMAITATNWLGIVVAAVVAMIIGFIWYSPALFGKQWMKLSGVSQSNASKMMKNPVNMIGMFIAVIISALVLQLFIIHSAITTVTGGIALGFLVWLGFVATSNFGMAAMSGKPWSLYIIQNVHLLIGLVVMGAILVVL